MRKLIAGAVVAGWAAGATAADPVPVSVYPPLPAQTLPGTVVPTRPVRQEVPAPAADVTKPLSSVLDAAPAAPSTPAAMPAYPAATPTPAYVSPVTCGPCESSSSRWVPRLKLGSTPCLDRLCGWFAWKPGPRVNTNCTPTPYQPPLRSYLPPTKMVAPAAATQPPGCTPLIAGRTPILSGLSNLFGGRGEAGCTSCGKSRCDGCNETLCDKALGCVTPRQFGRALPQCWVSPRAPQVSACAQGNCHGGDAHPGVTAPSGGVVYPGVGGGYRFASPMYVPAAPPINASMAAPVASGGVGVAATTAAVGGNAGAVGTGAPGGGAGGK